MDTMVIMDRRKLMLRLLQDICMATPMIIMDMEDMDIMETEAAPGYYHDHHGYGGY